MRRLTVSRAFRAQVMAGDIKIASFNWPVFCYDESKFDSGNPKQGLLQGKLLLRVYRHIFTGRSSVYGGKPKGRSARGVLNGLTEPTPETIAYAAVIVRICSIAIQSIAYLFH